MTTPDDIESRVERLEAEVARLRHRVIETGHDAVAARLLAGGADRDVSEVRAELRAHTRALNALRETQSEFGARLDAVERRLTSLEARVGSLDTEMRAGFAEMRSGMAQIVSLLGGAPRS